MLSSPLFTSLFLTTPTKGQENADFHFLPEGGHEGNELGAAYVTFEEGKWQSFTVKIANRPEFPIYELYMEVPYTIECYMFLNGVMMNYPAK